VWAISCRAVPIQPPPYCSSFPAPPAAPMITVEIPATDGGSVGSATRTSPVAMYVPLSAVSMN